MTLRLRCPAKVNLHLEVLGRRADGYHELLTLFAAVGLWDELAIEPAPPGEISLCVEPPGWVTEGADNLVMQAARRLLPLARSSAGAALTLSKRIPVGGGLGGGSADAACALVGLARFWQLDLSDAELAATAALLGSDVPFFLVGGAAWGTGRGTELTPVADLPAWCTVLLAGAEPIETAAVYRRLAAPAVDVHALSEVYESVARGEVPQVQDWRNNLEGVVLGGWPEVGLRLAAVRRTAPMLAQLSGSGGTVFGLYADESAARVAAAELASWGPMVAPLLARHDSVPRAWEV